MTVVPPGSCRYPHRRMYPVFGSRRSPSDGAFPSGGSHNFRTGRIQSLAAEASQGDVSTPAVVKTAPTTATIGTLHK